MTKTTFSNLELPTTLSKRDYLCLLMLAASTLDDRIAVPHSKNRLNFSGALLDSSHPEIIEDLYMEMNQWTPNQLLDFAAAMIERAK